jgi:hypothetical protein
MLISSGQTFENKSIGTGDQKRIEYKVSQRKSIFLFPCRWDAVTTGVYVMAELKLGRLRHQEKPISQTLFKTKKKKID